MSAADHLNGAFTPARPNEDPIAPPSTITRRGRGAFLESSSKVSLENPHHPPLKRSLSYGYLAGAPSPPPSGPSSIASLSVKSEAELKKHQLRALAILQSGKGLNREDMRQSYNSRRHDPDYGRLTGPVGVDARSGNWGLSNEEIGQDTEDKSSARDRKTTVMDGWGCDEEQGENEGLKWGMPIGQVEILANRDMKNEREYQNDASVGPEEKKVGKVTISTEIHEKTKGIMAEQKKPVMLKATGPTAALRLEFGSAGAMEQAGKATLTLSMDLEMHNVLMRSDGAVDTIAILAELRSLLVQQLKEVDIEIVK